MPIYNTGTFWNYVFNEDIECINDLKQLLTKEYYDYTDKKYKEYVYYTTMSKIDINGDTFETLRFPSGLTKYLIENTDLNVVDCSKPIEKVSDNEILSVANEIKRINSDFEVRDYQLDAVKTSLGRFSSLIQSTVGSGKGQPVSLKIPTPDGVKTFGSLKIGDKVFGSDGKPTIITGVFPQGEKDIYKLSFTYGQETICDESHLWTFETQRGNRKTYSTLELLDLNKAGKVDYERFRCLQQPAAEYSEKEYDIHPYVLGVIIGDASCSNQNVTIYSPLCDHEIIDKVKNLVNDDIYYIKDNHKYKSCSRYYIRLRHKKRSGNVGYINKLRNLGLNCKSIHKFIPQVYLEGSVEQRLELLRGLMDTDGTCVRNKTGSTSRFSTSSLRLAEDVKTLVFSLGGYCHICVDKHRDNPNYLLTIRLSICPFSLKRKADVWNSHRLNNYLKSIEYVGKEETVCIKVSAEDELYLTSDYVITHNTSIMSLTSKLLKDKKIFITNGNNFILQQIYDRLVSFGEDDISWNPSSEPDYSKHIVIMNTSSSDVRLNKHDENYINFLKEVQIWQIDECAHFQSLTNFEPIFYMDPDKLEHIIGYTATPFRNYKDPYKNEQDFTLISLLGEPAFVYEMKDTIADKNIAQPYGYFIKYKNEEHFVPSKFKDNYFMQYRANITYNKKRNDAGLAMLKFLNENNIKTLAYFNNIKPGQAMMKRLKEEGVDSIFICGSETIYEWVYTKTGKLKLETRKGNIDDVKNALNGDVNIVFGSSVMAEGVDISTFQASVLFSAGKSYISLIQISGRSSRKKAVNNISFVIDFRDLGGNYIFTNQYKQRRKAMEDSGIIILEDAKEFVKMVKDLSKK